VVSDDLTELQAEFPAFHIWREDFPGRARYVARSRYRSLNPHTVVTTDLRELRAALRPRCPPAPTDDGCCGPEQAGGGREDGGAHWAGGGTVQARTRRLEGLARC
jgi:hypothetical protein